MRLSPETLARASSRHPWRTLAIWFVAIIGMGYLSSVLLSDVLSQDFDFTNKPESVQAQEVLDQAFKTNTEQDTELIIVHSDTLSADDPAFQAAVNEVRDSVTSANQDTLVGQALTYYDLAESSPDQAAGLLSKDGQPEWKETVDWRTQFQLD